MHWTTDWRGAYPRTSLCQGGKRGQVDPGVMVLAMTAAMSTMTPHMRSRHRDETRCHAIESGKRGRSRLAPEFGDSHELLR